MGRKLKIRQDGDTVTLFDTTPQVYETVWKDYFDFGADYEKLTAAIAEDAVLGDTVQAYYGIRILRQDSWEALCSFIFSSTNNIKRIQGFIEKISCRYGEDLGDGFYAFPTAERLAQVGCRELRALGAGYRDVFLTDGAQKVASGEVNLEKIREMELGQARSELMKIRGVGPKVAECTLLFGFYRLDAFPVDRWIHRVLSLYPDGLPECFDGCRGLAQQYMFHFARMNNIAKDVKP